MSAFDDIIAGLQRAAQTPAFDPIATRRVCARDGHQYRVRGKLRPERLECKRCRVTWAIGPRTEPSTP